MIMAVNLTPIGTLDDADTLGLLSYYKGLMGVVSREEGR